jgi:hypothetical protein
LNLSEQQIDGIFYFILFLFIVNQIQTNFW